MQCTRAAHMLSGSPSKRLCYSAATNNVEQLKHLVEKKKFAYDRVYHNNMTPFITACAASQYEAVLYLLGRGADIDGTDLNGKKTALMHAVIHGHLTIVETLLNNGCDIHAVDAEKKNALDYAKEAAAQECPTHKEHVEWCNDATACTFHKGRKEIVTLLQEMMGVHDENEVPLTPESNAETAHFDDQPRLSEGLPVGWEATTDPESGDTYYFNVETQQSQWEEPMD